MMDSSPQTDYDVVIMGGGFSGAATAVLLKRRQPDLRILIVEKSTEFTRKVGESTSEVAGTFLTRELGLTRYLTLNHVTKHGLRMWFNDGENDCVNKCSEIGAYYQVNLPTFQLDRAELDQHLYELAAEKGCEQWRPASVKSVETGGVGKNRLEIKIGEEMRSITAGWVVDASGKAAHLARKMEMVETLSEHPVNSMWTRFRNVGDLDSHKLREMYPCFANALYSPRGPATNHLCGRGWWVWIIPLRNGDVSAGITWDRRLFTPPEGATIADRLKTHLLSDPIGKELFQDAEGVEGDSYTYSQLGYYSKKVAGDGWFIVGDATGFMDPLYSHGLDFCSYTTTAAARLITDSQMGKDVCGCIEMYNEAYRANFQRWFDALYREKYHYIGDAELMYAAFLLDIAAYFIGPVREAHATDGSEFFQLPYDSRIGAVVAKVMALYNRRLTAIAKKKMAAGVYGKKNVGHRMLIKKGFAPGASAAPILMRGIGVWIRCEIKALFLRPAPGMTEEAEMARPMAAPAK